MFMDIKVRTKIKVLNSGFKAHNPISLKNQILLEQSLDILWLNCYTTCT